MKNENIMTDDEKDIRENGIILDRSLSVPVYGGTVDGEDRLEPSEKKVRD